MRSYFLFFKQKPAYEVRISEWSSDVCSSDLERGGLIAGDLTIPEARYKIIRQGAADVPELQGVRRKGAPTQQDSAQGGVPSRSRLRINDKADNRIFVSGMGPESECKSNVRSEGSRGGQGWGNECRSRWAAVQ